VNLDAECPRCAFRMQLPMAMAGRSIRCPNPDCGAMFEVPPPVAEVIVPAKPKPKPAAAKPKPKEVRWSDADEPKAKPKPKEVRWSEEPKPAEEPDEPIRAVPRRKKQSRSPMILAGLAAMLMLGAAGFVVFLFLSREKAERRSAEAAELAYRSGEYAEARRGFAELASNHEGSENLPRYRFFASLSQLQSDVQQLKADGSPEEAYTSFAQFLEQFGESPLAKPGDGHGGDIVVLAQKLAGVARDFCEGLLKEHRRRRDDTTPLDTSAKFAQRARTLLAEVERFRDKDTPPSKDILSKFDAFDADWNTERRRATALAEWRTKLAAPSQAALDEFQTGMAALGLAGDAHAQSMLAAARQVLAERIRFMPNYRAAVPFPASDSPRFSSVPVPGSPRPRKGDSAAMDVAFGFAGGCLFACDAATGEFLWGRRIGPATLPRAMLDVPTIAPELSPLGEAALVAFPHGLAAFKLRTGEPLWYQSLPAPCRARPVIAGKTLFAALLDDAGTIAALDLATGAFLGSIALQQPHGANLLLLKSTDNSPFLLATGLARQAYFFQVVPDNTTSLEFIRGIVTGHEASSVLAEPVTVIQVFPDPTPRFILTTAAGTGASKLTEYALPPAAEWKVPSGEWTAPRLAEKTLTGWPWLPPVSDGERLAFATDSGMVGWYGWKSPGRGLFPLLPEPVAEMGDAVSRSCIAALAEDSLCVVAGENLVRYQTAVGPQGLRMVAEKKPRRVGEAVGRPQAFGSVAVLAVKPGTGAVQLLAWDTDRGEPAWQVELKVE
jgi:hypothetical protein